MTYINPPDCGIITAMKSKKTPEARQFIRKGLESFVSHYELAKQIEAKFGVHHATAKTWIYSEYAEIHDEEKPLLAFRKVRNRRAMERLAFHCLRMVESKGGCHWATVAIRALDHLAKLDGLYEPDKVEVTEARRRPEDMTPLERRNAIEALLAKRRAAGFESPDAAN